MAIAPGLDGFLAAQQMGQQRQGQQLGALTRLLQLQGQMAQDQRAAELAPLQRANFQSQINARAAESKARSDRLQALGMLQNELATNPSPNTGRIQSLAMMAAPEQAIPAFMKNLYPAQPKPVAPSGISKLISERDALPPNDPRRSIYEQAIARQTTPQAGTTVVLPKQETKFQEGVGTEFSKIYTGAIKAEFNAPRTTANYERLGNLLSQVNTGKFAGTTMELKALGKRMGVDLEAMGIKDDVAPAQATRQISNMLALELRNPAGGAGMPGAMSDKDREFLQQSIPSIENDPGAIGKMIEYRKLLAKRDQQVGKMARDYRKRKGTFDEGFFDELRQFSDANPLFPQAPAAPATGGVRFLGFENAPSR